MGEGKPVPLWREGWAAYLTNPVCYIILVLLTDTLAEKLIKYIRMKPEGKTIKKTKNRLLNIVLLFVVYLTLFAVNSFGQSITWQREFPEYYGIISRVQQTYDGGYIAVGGIRIANTYKMRLMKFNPFGYTIWSKIIGIGSTDGYWVEETSDRGLIIGGSTDSGFGNQKVYLVKTDSTGNTEWQRTYSVSDLDQCHCVKQTIDGGYILSCRTHSLAHRMLCL